MKFIYMVKIEMKRNITFLIEKREDVGAKHFNDSKALIKYSNKMADVYKSINEYNPNKKRKIIIVFDDMTLCLIIKKP